QDSSTCTCTSESTSCSLTWQTALRPFATCGATPHCRRSCGRSKAAPWSARRSTRRAPGSTGRRATGPSRKSSKIPRAPLPWSPLASCEVFTRGMAPADRQLVLSNRRFVVGALHAATRRILAGTDSGIDQTAAGTSIHDELAELVASGLSPYEALWGATYGGA